MKKIIIAADEASVRGTCGTATYQLSRENDDNGLEVTFELSPPPPTRPGTSRSTRAGPRSSPANGLVLRQDGRQVLKLAPTADGEGDLDVETVRRDSAGKDVFVSTAKKAGSNLKVRSSITQ